MYAKTNNQFIAVEHASVWGEGEGGYKKMKIIGYGRLWTLKLQSCMTIERKVAFSCVN